MNISPKDFVISYNQLYGVYKPVYTVIPFISKPSSSSSILDNEYKLLDYNYHSIRLKQILLNDNDNDFNKKVLEVCKNEIMSKIDNNNSNDNSYGLMTICCHNDNNNIYCKSLLSLSLGYNFNNIDYCNNNNDYIADMFLHKRNNPMIKACSWPEERLYIEKQKNISSIETLLYYNTRDNDCFITEGLTTNVYCFDHKDMKLYTAPKSLVLSGSMGYIVESVCNSMNVEVIHKAVKLSTIIDKEFDIFLTSATKPVQKLTHLIHPNRLTITKLPSHESNSGKKIYEIRKNVLNEIKERFKNALPL